MTDSDGYPTEEALVKIQEWPVGDFVGLMDFVHGLWYLDDWGWRESVKADRFDGHPYRRFHISTAGWSGNESVIGAMRANVVFWMFAWWNSRRGGHYEFRIPEPPAEEASP